MKRKLIVIFLIVTPVIAYSQLVTDISSFEQNYLIYNPAAAGNQEVLTSNFMYRARMVGFKGGAMTEILSAHAPLRNPAVALGFSVFHDAIGSRNNTGITLDYAFRIKMGMNRLSFGLLAGIHGNSVDNITLRDDQFDRAFSDEGKVYYMPGFGLGVLYYSRQYWAGFSVPSLFSNESKPTGKYGMKLRPERCDYFLSGGAKFHAGGNIIAESSALIRLNAYSYSKVSLTLIGSALYKKAYRAGLGLRTGDALIFLAGYQINRQFFIGYSYDAGIGKISRYSSGSHEININYKFGYNVNTSDPREF